MSDNSVSQEMSGDGESPSSGGGREKQRIRIKYRQRVKIKKRPRGYKITRLFKKHQKNVFAYLVIGVLLTATLYMVVQVAKQRIEANQHQSRSKLRTK
jgi:hypothetical protein